MTEETGIQNRATVLSLPVEGMTCASCVARVETVLRTVEGVDAAAVNLATERATVRFDPARVSLNQLQQAVRQAGYTLQVPSVPAQEATVGSDPGRTLRAELILSAALAAPVMLIGMAGMTGWFEIPLSLDDTNKILLLLTTPILFGPGRRFFKGAFAAGCERLGIRVTRTKPRHAWTNGFVERLQKTILHEHWRIAFRRQYFTGRRALQASLDRFLQFYNDERTHRGYRLRGRTPATVFKGAVAA